MIAVEATPDVGTCPAGNGHQPCDLRGWIYRTESINPRMYSKCWACGGWTIALLPRQDQYPPSDLPDDTDSQIIDAIEHTLRERGVANRVAQLFVGDPLILREVVLDGLAERIRRGFKEQIDTSRRLSESHGYDIEEEIRRQVEERVGKTQRRLESLHRKMERLVSDTAETIRAAIRQERAKLNPKPPVGDVLCDSRHSLPTIYGLIAPSEPERVRYVGQSLNAGSRYGSHCSEAAAPRVREWIKSLGESPLMILLENCHAVELTDRENYWIQRYRGQGMADLNTSVRETAP